MAKLDITTIIEDAFTSFDFAYELVDVEYVKEGYSWILRVFIDKPQGITLEDCESVSKRLSSYLDEQDPIDRSYSLEVSSPGVERPLKKRQDYERFTGSEVFIRTFAPIDGRKKFAGELKGVAGDDVIVATEAGVLMIPLDKITKAHLVFRFEKDK